MVNVYYVFDEEENRIEFLAKYGLWAVAVGSFFEGQVMLFGAAILASQHILDPTEVFLAAGISAWAGHIFWYGFGRLIQFPLINRYFPQSHRSFKRLGSMIDNRPFASIVFVQYGYGIRLIGSIAFGFTQIPLAWFSLVQSINCFTWAAIVGTLGYTMGHTFTSSIPSQVKYLWVGVSLFLVFFILPRIFRDDRTIPEPDVLADNQ